MKGEELAKQNKVKGGKGGKGQHRGGVKGSKIGVKAIKAG